MEKASGEVQQPEQSDSSDMGFIGTARVALGWDPLLPVIRSPVEGPCFTALNKESAKGQPPPGTFDDSPSDEGAIFSKKELHDELHGDEENLAVLHDSVTDSHEVSKPSESMVRGLQTVHVKADATEPLVSAIRKQDADREQSVDRDHDAGSEQNAHRKKSVSFATPESSVREYEIEEGNAFRSTKRASAKGKTKEKRFHTYPPATTAEFDPVFSDKKKFAATGGDENTVCSDNQKAVTSCNNGTVPSGVDEAATSVKEGTVPSDIKRAVVHVDKSTSPGVCKGPEIGTSVVAIDDERALISDDEDSLPSIDESTAPDSDKIVVPSIDESKPKTILSNGNVELEADVNPVITRRAWQIPIEALYTEIRNDLSGVGVTSLYGARAGGTSLGVHPKMHIYKARREIKLAALRVKIEQAQSEENGPPGELELLEKELREVPAEIDEITSWPITTKVDHDLKIGPFTPNSTTVDEDGFVVIKGFDLKWSEAQDRNWKLLSTQPNRFSWINNCTPRVSLGGYHKETREQAQEMFVRQVAGKTGKKCHGRRAEGLLTKLLREEKEKEQKPCTVECCTRKLEGVHESSHI